MQITTEQIARFREDGFVSVSRLLDEQGVEAARNAFDSLFRGEFERGILPDEVKLEGRQVRPIVHAPDMQRLEGERCYSQNRA